LFFRLCGRGPCNQAFGAAILQQVIEDKWKIASPEFFENYSALVMRMLHGGNRLK
jgi:hypothetical protein